MKRINERNLAVKVCETEGGSENLSVAQVAEVIKKTLDELAREVSENASGILELIERHRP